MQFFILDETDIHDTIKRDSNLRFDVLICGGIIISEITLKGINDFIKALKIKYKLPKEAEIKWSSEKALMAWGYDTVESLEKKTELVNRYKDLKHEILKYVSNSDISIQIVIRPTELIHLSRESAQFLSFSNASRKFERILKKKGDLGMIIADRFLSKDHGNNLDEIKKVWYEGTRDGQFDNTLLIVPNMISDLSYAHQVNDVVLGCIKLYMATLIKDIDLKPDYNAQDESLHKYLMGLIVDKFDVPMKSYKHDRLTLNSGILIEPPKQTRYKGGEPDVFLDKLEEKLKQDFSIC